MMTILYVVLGVLAVATIYVTVYGWLLCELAAEIIEAVNDDPCEEADRDASDGAPQNRS